MYVIYGGGSCVVVYKVFMVVVVVVVCMVKWWYDFIFVVSVARLVWRCCFNSQTISPQMCFHHFNKKTNTLSNCETIRTSPHLHFMPILYLERI